MRNFIISLLAFFLIASGTYAYSVIVEGDFIQMAQNETLGAPTQFIVATSVSSGFGTSSPWGFFSIELDQQRVNSATPVFVIGDNGTGTPAIIVDEIFNVGVSTTTPGALFSVGGSMLIQNVLNIEGNMLMKQGTSTAFTITSLGAGAGTFIAADPDGNLIATSTPSTSVAALDDIGDVTITSAAFGDLISWNGSAWVDTATSTLEIALSDTKGTLAINRGGTGQTSTPSFGQLLQGNSSSGFDLVATSTLGVFLSDTRGTLAVSRGGTGLTTFGGANTILYTSAADTLASNANFVFDGTNLGINDTSPTFRLDITGEARFTDYVDVSYLVATSTTATSTFGYDIRLGLQNADSPTDYRIQTAINSSPSSSNLRLQPYGGSVIIGTDNTASDPDGPTSFSVQGSLGGTIVDINNYGAGGSGLSVRTPNHSDSDYTIVNFGNSGNADEFVMLGNGKAGFGFRSADLGQITGQLNASSTNSVVAIFDQRGTSDIMQLQDAGTVVLTVRDGGNVGIGTTTPAYLTDINGTMRVGIQGDSSAFLLFANTTTNRVGIGSSTPSQLFSVGGSAEIQTDLIVNGALYATQERNFHVGSTTKDNLDDASFDTGTSTWDVWYPDGVAILETAYCKADPSGSMLVRIGDGTNWVPEFDVGSGGSEFSPTSNNVWTDREKVRIEAGTATSTVPDYVTCTFTFRKTP